MEKEFVKYEQALALKELGFDEPCLGYYDTVAVPYLTYPSVINKNSDIENSLSISKQDKNVRCSAPTYSQAFRFFREKHNLMFNLNCYNFVKPIEYHWSITWNDEAKGHGLVETYEEAESACLDKLIEIVRHTKP